MKKRHLRLSDAELSDLSARLYVIGEECAGLRQRMEAKGYWEPVRIVRDELREFATSDEEFRSLEPYWTEYAKERVASLTGPVDIELRTFPPFAAYRSAFLDELSKASGPRDRTGPGRQIQPVLRRWMERSLQPPFDRTQWLRRHEQVKLARVELAAAHKIEEMQDFRAMEPDQQWQQFHQRMKDNLSAAGFNAEPTRRRGAVFRRSMSGQEGWCFAVVDETRESAGTGRVDVSFVLTKNEYSVVPGAVFLNAAIALRPYHLVWGIEGAFFSRALSYVESCLAADVASLLGIWLFERMDVALAGTA